MRILEIAEKAFEHMLDAKKGYHESNSDAMRKYFDGIYVEQRTIAQIAALIAIARTIDATNGPDYSELLFDEESQ